MVALPLKENCLLVAKVCFRNGDGAMQVDSKFDSLGQIHVKIGFVSSAFLDTLGFIRSRCE